MGASTKFPGELSSNFRENKGRNLATFAFISFAQYCISDHLTIIPRARMGCESIAHSAFGLMLDECLQLLFVVVARRGCFVNSVFPNKKNRSLFMTNENESTHVCGNCTFEVNRTKNIAGKRRFTSSNRAAMSLVLLGKKDAKNLFHLLGEFTENIKARFFFLFFLLETFNGAITVPFSHYVVACGMINLRIAMFENSTKI